MRLVVAADHERYAEERHAYAEKLQPEPIDEGWAAQQLQRIPERVQDDGEYKRAHGRTGKSGATVTPSLALRCAGDQCRPGGVTSR